MRMRLKKKQTGDWEVIYLGKGEIEKIPVNGEIEIGSTTDLETWTNQDIVIEITWPENSEYYNKQVSIDGGKTWKQYTGKITIEENTKIIAKVEDKIGNEIKKSTLEVSKIDKEKPTVELSPNGGIGYVMPLDANGVTGKATIRTKLIATDEGGSELKTLQYAWNQSIENEPTSWIDFENGQEIAKTYISEPGTWYLWTNIIDTAGNRATEVKKSEGFVISANTESEYLLTLTADYTDWTTNDITVTANYGASLIPSSLTCTGTKDTDYTVNGTTSVVVKTNNQTVTAIAVDKAGNMITATLTVTKIDKNPPIVTANTESVTIFEGDTKDIKSYFIYSQNGDAPISSVVYTDTSKSNAIVTNTSSLAVGTHEIKCTVTKENGETKDANITIIVERKVYSISDLYQNKRANQTGYDANALHIGDFVTYTMSSSSDYSNAYSVGVKDSNGNVIKGWRIFDIADDGSMTLISAGMPETYSFKGDGAGSTSELLAKSCSNYRNSQYPTTGAKVLSKDILQNWYQRYLGQTGDIYDSKTVYRTVFGTEYETMIDAYSNYYLAGYNSRNRLILVDPRWNNDGKFRKC